MSRPTILIGIGSGGLRSIEAAWKLSQEIADPQNKPLVEYIYLETDKANKPISQDIVMSSLVITDINASRHAVVSDLNATSQWFANQTFPANVFNGAGGSPVLGRMTLWDKVNRNQFISSLQAAQNRLTTHSIEKPLVYVVGSLGGGTGSGTFLDIAYLIRDALANQVELHGVFMVPNLGLSDDVIYSNTVCALKELDYYMEEHEFPFKWAANPPKGYQEENKPYELVQIISASYDSGLAPVTYSQLHEEVGLFLYLNVLGMYDTRRVSLVDASGNVIISNYTTFGLSAIHYPETEIKEYLANKLSSEMLGHLIDGQNYFDQQYQQYRSIKEQETYIRNSVKATFDRKFKTIIEQWCGLINIVEGSQELQVEMHLESLSRTLASNNSSYKEKKHSLYNFFRVGGDYYQQLNTYASTNAVDVLVDVILNEVKEALSEYQNINIADIALESIEASLVSIQNYWNANGYTKNPQDWNDRLNKDIVNTILPMPVMYKLLAEKEKVYYDRLKYVLLYGLAMHIFSDSLSRIINVLKGQKDANGTRLTICNSKGELMPTKWLLSEWKGAIKNVRENQNPNYKSCSQAMSSLAAKLNNNSAGNIVYIFPEGNFQDTLKVVEAKFRHDFSQERRLFDVTGNDDVYGFLDSIKRNLRMNEYVAEEDLYSKVVLAYLAKINVGDFSVSEALNSNKHNDLISLVEKKSQIPHLPVNPIGRNAIFESHKNIPHILVGFDGDGKNILTAIEKNLEDNLNIFDFKISDKNRNTFSHIGLNNWLIFYQEYGRMSDGHSFSVIDDLRDFYDYSSCYLADFEKIKANGTSQSVYHGKRMPYISYDVCHSMATNYINKAQGYVSSEELETALKYYKYAMYWEMSSSLPANKIAELESILKRESIDARLNRYIQIAERYFAAQDYPNASDYYKMAYKLDDANVNVRSRLSEIDTISLQVANLLNRGDELCTEVNANYEQCILSPNRLGIAQCGTRYQEVLDIYNQALVLSKNNEDTLKKIANVKRRIKSINENN